MASPTPGNFEVICNADTSRLALLREGIRERLKGVVDGRLMNRLLLAVDEAVSNVMIHSLENNPEATFELCMNVQDDRIEFVITDRGKPFNPLNADPADPAEHGLAGKSHGLGVQIYRTIMDHIEYREMGDGAHSLMMVKYLGDGEENS